MELVFGEELVDELPVRTFGDILATDSTDLSEVFLRIGELSLGSDIVEISILDDIFEMRPGSREEYCCHDDLLYFGNPILWMVVFLEPLASDPSSDMFVFLILLWESSVMEEAGELEILEILRSHIFRHSDIGRSIEYTDAMFGVVIGIFFAYLEEVLSIFASLGYERVHRL
jgi:hypothetical protein